MSSKKNFSIIPAIDLMDGKCVRLSKGDFDKRIVYYDDPLVAAKQFEDAGLTRLHLVDLDGARAGDVVNLKTLERLATHTNLDIDFGGGIKTENNLRMVFDAGAKMAAIGSIAVTGESIFLEWLNRYGASRFFLGADVKDNKIAISGWLKQTEIDVFDFIEKYSEKGINYFFCTDISKDGMLTGPALALYHQLLERFPNLELIASGGISQLSDLEELENIGCSGAIVGKAFYENRIHLKDLTRWLG